jgi:hypothetical protein
MVYPAIPGLVKVEQLDLETITSLASSGLDLLIQLRLRLIEVL